MLTMIWVSALVYVLRKKEAAGTLPQPLKAVVLRIPVLGKMVFATNKAQ